MYCIRAAGCVLLSFFIKKALLDLCNVLISMAYGQSIWGNLTGVILPVNNLHNKPRVRLRAGLRHRVVAVAHGAVDHRLPVSVSLHLDE